MPAPAQVPSSSCFQPRSPGLSAPWVAHRGPLGSVTPPCCPPALYIAPPAPGTSLLPPAPPVLLPRQGRDQNAVKARRKGGQVPEPSMGMTNPSHHKTWLLSCQVLSGGGEGQGAGATAPNLARLSLQVSVWGCAPSSRAPSPSPARCPAPSCRLPPRRQLPSYFTEIEAFWFIISLFLLIHYGNELRYYQHWIIA